MTNKRIEDIENWAMISHQGVHPQVTLSKSDFDYVINEAKKAERYEKGLKEIAESKADSSCNELAMEYEVIADRTLN